MFVVLQVQAHAAGFLQRLKEYISPEEPELTKIAVKNGAPFFILKVKKNKQGIPWEDVAFAAGRCASRIVAPKMVELPESGPVRRFVPEYLPFMMLYQTVLDVLGKSGVSPSKVSIGIVDRRGILAGVIDKAAKSAGVVKVVTDVTERYTQAAENLMDELGASLMFGTQAQMLRDCKLIISGESAEACSEEAAVFSLVGNGESTVFDKSFMAGYAVLPVEYASLKPEDIDTLVFASALYELCGVRRLENLTYKTLICGETEVGLYKAAQRLRGILSG